MQLHACSFASGSFNIQQAAQRCAFIDVGISEQRIYCCGPSVLEGDFLSRFPGAGEDNRFAFYSFKPYFLERILTTLPRGDVLVYLDVNDRPTRGFPEYILKKFNSNRNLNIFVAGTNYPNNRHMSWYHRLNLAMELRLTSFFRAQPEAGFVAIRCTAESLALLRVWYELTSLHALGLFDSPDSRSRHDQETLFLISRMSKAVDIEPWLIYKLLGNGVRRFIDWEAFRNLQA